MTRNTRKSGSERVPQTNDGRSTLAIWLFAPFRFLYKLWFFVVFMLSMIVLYPFFWLLLRDPKTYPKAFKLKCAWANFLQWSILAPVRIEHRGELPEPPYIICSNHSSYIDIIQMYNVIPDMFIFMGKHTLLKWPLFRIFFRTMNIAVNRGNRMEAARSLEQAAQVLKDGRCLAIFPEGTIPRPSPRLGRFKDGAFKLAIDEQVPIVPVVFRENWRIFGDPDNPFKTRGRPGIAHTIIQPAVDAKGMTSADLVDLRNRVFDLIEEPLLEDADKR